MSDNTAVANELKDKGNLELKNNRYDDAIKYYTEAIALVQSAIYYSNRAQAHIKSENYGLAIADATKAIEIDPAYLKAYYRRAVAESAILEYKKSLADVKKVLARAPKDPSCLKLHQDLTKVLKTIAFENAIAVNEKQSPIAELDFDSMIIEAGYKGPELQIQVDKATKAVSTDLDLKYVGEMVELFKEGGKIPKKHAFAIVCVANQIFKQEKSLVEIGLKRSKTAASGELQLEGCETITICGDTHGQFYDVLNIFSTFGDTGPNHTYLFNGDFVDRGSWSCEVALLFYCFKILYPQNFYMNRGNHETNDMNQVYGFADECKAKYSHKLFLCFSESFNALPYATLIGQEYLVMHGGLFSDDNIKVDDIRKIDRLKNKQPPKQGIEMELLWTDPQPEEGRSASKRGIGMQFGPDVTAKFCEQNDLKAIIRSHEVRMGGYELEHNGKLITVFSAPNYCDSQHNLGAVINLKTNSDGEYDLDFKTFKEVPHPNIGPMAYTRNMGF
ncbi:unnamed protein product [Kuraishia capsulata CBS 1993]|uniref:Serine/threonine-protein phosphatase n=1 Tax=Kuraishia capsulata CBS 1993 TaxID=1382522 RepID=W6MTM9_9ASCO|nr:uncharacterized protein KUCA_T00001107001 [Kuraishia capsulata CBS 1993]CDK25140.1 unnamed protein product [Kuraishia capsulata CBS 1993]